MRRALFIFALLVTLPCLAANQVYHWTDSAGTTHFSDTPPPDGVDYTLVDLATGATSPPPEPAKAASVDSADSAAAAAQETSAADKPKSLPDTPANRTKICKKLAKNIALLESDRPLTISTESSKPMPTDMRKQRLSTDRGRFQKYCSLK